MFAASLVLVALLSDPRHTANEVIAAFQRNDPTAITALWSAQSPHRLTDGKRMRKAALDPRPLFTGMLDGSVLCLEAREPDGTLLDEYAIELRLEDGQWRIWSATPILATPLQRARTTLRRGNDAVTSGALDEAVAHFTAAIALTDHGPTLSAAEHGLGYVAYIRGDAAAAAVHFQKSLEHAHRANDRSAVGRAFEGLAAADRQQGDLRRAEERTVEALRLLAAAGDRVWYGLTLGSLGSLHMGRGDYRGARRLYRESLDLARETGNVTGEIYALVNLGVNARHLGRYSEATELLTEALRLSEADDDLTGLAFSHANLGATLAAQGHLPEAVQAFEKGLAMKERLGRIEPIVLELANVGEMYRRLGNHEQAAAQFERALSLARQFDLRPEIARGLHNLGQLTHDRGDARAAIALYEQALAIDRELGNRGGVARDLQTIGQAQLAAGERKAARRAFEQSLAIAEEIEARDAMATSLAMLAQIAASPAEALALAERAAGIATELGLPEHLWTAQLAHGRALRRAGKLDDARVAIEQAIAVVEELHRGVPGEEAARQQAFARLVEPYHELIALLVQRGDAAGALEAAERAKARVLLDVLRNGRPDLGSVLTESERAREAELAAAIAELNRAYRDKPPGGASKALRKARLEYDAFLTSLYAAHPQLRSERGEVTPLRAQELGGVGPFVEFVVTSERTYIFTNGVRVQTVDVSERELEAEVRRFRELLASRDLLYESAARALYDRLLRGIAPQWRGKQTLCIVPDGPLWELPFHALQPAAGEFLLDRYAVHYAPSLSVLREMAGRSRSAGAARLLAFGNPVLPGAKPGVWRDVPLAPLPHTEDEIRAIASLYGANNSRLRLRAEAREELVKAEAGGFDILHFATHGILDDQNALHSRLVFSPPAQPREDGLLEAREIMRLDLRARLAVLSACETARGRVSSGEGLIGMSWALFVAGVPATVVSQWKVDSTSTSELMIAFHRNLRQGRSNAEALRRAALATRANYRHPFYWAPFVVVGRAD